MDFIQFTKNIYDILMPTHLKRIYSVIDKLPHDLDFEVSEQSEQGESDFHRGWKATISPTNQVMMLHLYWRKLTVNQAVLVRETLPLILHCLRGSTGKHLKS